MIIRRFLPSDIHKGLIETYSEVWDIDHITEDVLDCWLCNDNIMVVAEDDDGIIVGTCTLHLQRKFIRNGGIAGFIEDVAVREHLRGQNIGSQLIQHALEIAKDEGCYKVILSCFPERVAFYERNGFKQECITMRYNF
jgi:glucosamine-phosphate N-acetyltransferase